MVQDGGSVRLDVVDEGGGRRAPAYAAILDKKDVVLLKKKVLAQRIVDAPSAKHKSVFVEGDRLENAIGTIVVLDVHGTSGGARIADRLTGEMRLDFSPRCRRAEDLGVDVGGRASGGNQGGGRDRRDQEGTSGDRSGLVVRHLVVANFLKTLSCIGPQ